MKLLSPFVLALAAVPIVAQSSQVETAWFARANGDQIDARIVIDVADGFHIYHSDLGHPAAAGKPTQVTFGGSGVTWNDVLYPEPHLYPDTDWATNTQIMVNVHEGHVVLMASGTLAVPGAVPADLNVTVAGLVCNTGGCIPFSLDNLALEGEGDDALFAAGDAADEGDAVVYDDNDWHESGEADATLYVRRGEGDLVEAAITISISDGYHLYGADLGHENGHLYAKATELEWTAGDVEWDDVDWPQGHKLEIPYTEPGLWVWSYGADDTVVLRATGHADADVDLSEVALSLNGQTCDEQGCIDYIESVVNRGTGADALFATSLALGGEHAVADAPTTKGMASDGDAPAEESESLLQFLLLAVGWGLFALLMPCTYPMIPITISFFTKQAEARGGNVLPLALAYGAGIVLIFMLIGVTVGQAIIPVANHWGTNLVIGLMFIYFAFVLFGFINMQPPRFLLNVAGQASMKGGYIGVFLMGATLVVTSFTCTGPFVGSLLGYGAKLGLWQIALGMGVFGLTMAIPFVILSLVPGKVASMPQAGMWMNTIKHFLGFVEVAAAFKFLSNADLALGWTVISREFFLLVWAAMFILGGLYLLGVISPFGWDKEKPGIKQGLGGVLAVVFGCYCGWGFTGNTMDVNMQALIPPYSGGRVFPELWDSDLSWDLIEDDYDEALSIAKADNKTLLVNFTGHL